MRTFPTDGHLVPNTRGPGYRDVNIHEVKLRLRALINKLEADGEYSRQITAELALATIEHLQQKA